jgi:hypothetical protein
LETGVKRNQQDMDSEVLGVGFQMQQPQALLQQIYTEIASLQIEENQIVKDANTIFEGSEEKF